MPDEEWRPILGHEGSHEVSSRGRVRSLDRIDAAGARRKAKLLKARSLKSSHRIVVLYSGGARRDALVHHLVLEAFVGPRPDGMEGCHWNDEPTDNRLENLRWDTRSANQLDSVRNGTHYYARRTHCGHGHEFTPENIYRRPDGRRACVTCRRAQSRKAA